MEARNQEKHPIKSNKEQNKKTSYEALKTTETKE